MVITSVNRTGLPDIWSAAPAGLGYPPGHAFHLHKNLYGFQHSPRAFYDAFSEFLIEKLKFVRCTYDKTLFKRVMRSGVPYISLHVDDALVVCSGEEALTEFHKDGAETYDLSSVGDATLHLGLTISYDRKNGILSLGNANSIEQLAERFNIPLDTTCSPLSPFPKPRMRLYPSAITGEHHVGLREHQAYGAAVGSLNWLATTNRPDLAFAVSQLARHLATPTQNHVSATSQPCSTR